MYLQNFIRFHYLGEQAAKLGKDYPEIKYVTFRQYFEDHAFIYEIGASSYIDYEFEYLTDAIWPLAAKEKTDGLNDLELLHVLVRRVFVELKAGTPGLDDLMSKLYWHFLRGDSDSVWRCLVDYYNTAAGVE